MCPQIELVLERHWCVLCGQPASAHAHRCHWSVTRFLLKMLDQPNVVDSPASIDSLANVPSGFSCSMQESALLRQCNTNNTLRVHSHSLSEPDQMDVCTPSNKSANSQQTGALSPIRESRSSQILSCKSGIRTNCCKMAFK